MLPTTGKKKTNKEKNVMWNYFEIDGILQIVVGVC